jgi:hypothetical protein
MQLHQPLNTMIDSQNIQSYSQDKLCDIIASHRFLGCLKDQAIFCMKELARRRYMGDSFEFERVIDEKVAYLRSIK